MHSFDAPLSPTERRFLAETLDRLRRLESRTRGLYAESLVADTLPGATLAETSWCEWDITWRGITIGVRTTGAFHADSPPDGPGGRGSWAFPEVCCYIGDVATDERRRCWADVAVLAHHRDRDIATGWWFHVLPADVLNARRARTISVNAAQALAPAVDLAGLPAAVTAAAAVGESAQRGTDAEAN